MITKIKTITLIKILHSTIWFVMVIAIFNILYCGIVGDLNPFLWVALCLIVFEIFALVANNWSCPLTVLAKKAKTDWEDGDDIFLPKWIAINNKMIFTPPLVLGMILVIYRLLSQ